MTSKQLDLRYKSQEECLELAPESRFVLLKSDKHVEYNKLKLENHIQTAS